ncbi:MAG: zinc ribbon domain-containing protein [Synergistaceae bacterium]|nr:zinc ribbon domain-containing protein [Synergistaceae bacterium]
MKVNVLKKKCPVCGTEYSSEQKFCSKCGAELKSVAPAFEVINEDANKKMNASDWGGAVLAVIGFFVGWYESSLFGGACGFVAIMYARQSRYQPLKWAGYIIGGITVLISVLVLLLS